MAQSGYEADRPQPGDAAPKISGQRARQGQNIKGMVAVLVIGVALVVIAYVVMLALQQEPGAVVNESANEAAGAQTQQQFPTTPEQATPQSSPLPAQPQQ
jgi:hypothetical protein